MAASGRESLGYEGLSTAMDDFDDRIDESELPRDDTDILKLDGSDDNFAGAGGDQLFDDNDDVDDDPDADPDLDVLHDDDDDDDLDHEVDLDHNVINLCKNYF